MPCHIIYEYFVVWLIKLTPFQTIDRENIEAARALISLGININLQDADGSREA